ncbi:MULTISPECIES: hypothetical protein [Brucella]|uniref:Uncharacterized protein n=1 Tax=Brucella tritici TaxID=94626 RepID=A0A6L3Y309_9HYPH|nr:MULTISPECIES: hypothetical protein [Brucella]KAB2674869.1 hypothetical protein F9L08_28200 [Brucella tritici]KAB2740616.1 hypothetical protein F9K89_04405 [Brucella anthropi]
MEGNIWNWFIQFLSTTSLLSLGAVVLRGPISSFFSKSLENHFEKKIETFRAEIRDNESELSQIRSFLVTAQRERDSLLQEKRLQAAESLLRSVQNLSQLTMAAEYLKLLDLDYILRETNDDKMQNFIHTLIDPLNVDDKITKYSAIDKTLYKLYLSERPLRFHEAYEKIILHAITMLKIAASPISDKNVFKNTGVLSNDISILIPGSKAGFDQHGDKYAYHLVSYLYDELVSSLRREVAGTDEASRDTKSIERAAIDSRQAQLNIRANLLKAGLPESLAETGTK